MKKLRQIASILLLSVSAVFAAATTYDVRWQGSLQVVHGGDVSGKVSLQQFKGKKNLYAVGPVAELDGEITVIAGKIYIARVKHGELTTESDFSTSASFLVWSEVAAWQAPVPLGAKIENHAQFEKQIEALASKAGIDTSNPFPFKLEGVFERVDYHVLVPKTHQQAQAGHSDGAKKVSLRMADAEIVGFFSKNHQGVFTHKGSVAHLHVVERNGNSGHVDQIGASANVRVSFPQ
jgi:acetolactate decarboxylase